MGFYYFSILSWAVFAAYFAIAAAIIIKICEANQLSKYWKASLLAVAFIAPWTEELWIAYNFGQLCRKDSGKFIYKTVEVEGYYDDSSASLELVRSGKYRFIESPSKDREGYIRLTLGDPDFARAATEKYNQQNPGMEASKQDYIRATMDETTSALVYPSQGVSWRLTKIDEPTARYHNKFPHNHAPVGHKVTKLERVVIDSQTGDTLARETKYARHSYWFFIHLSAPVLLCPAPGERPQEERVGMLYDAVLKPIVVK